MGVLRSPRVLDPTEVPDQELIVHRSGEIGDIKAAIDRLCSSGAPSPFVLCGPPGTGKTMVSRHVLRERLSVDDVQTAYVDCWSDYDEYHLLSRVVDRLGVEVVHHNSTPTADLVDALQHEPELPRVVVLDELEMVNDTAPLQTLADAPALHVVGIVNDPDEIEETVAEVWGELSGRQQFHFRQYSVRQVSEILAKRAELGLRGNTLGTRTAEQIAEAADGDARLGICILRAASRHATEADADEITTEHIAAAVETAQQELHQMMLERLTDHQQTLYEIVRDERELAPKEIATRYRKRVDDPRSMKTIRTYLSKMEHYGLLVASGTTKDRTYRVDTSGYVDPGVIV